MTKQCIVKLRITKSRVNDQLIDLIQVDSDSFSNFYTPYQEFYFQNRWWQYVVFEIAHLLKAALLGTKNTCLSQKVPTNSCLSR